MLRRDKNWDMEDLWIENAEASVEEAVMRQLVGIFPNASNEKSFATVLTAIEALKNSDMVRCSSSGVKEFLKTVVTTIGKLQRQQSPDRPTALTSQRFVKVLECLEWFFKWPSDGPLLYATTVPSSYPLKSE